MAVKTVNESSLSQVAEAIRGKTNTSDPIIFPDGFVQKINEIQTAGGTNIWEERYATFCTGAGDIVLPKMEHAMLWQDMTNATSFDCSNVKIVEFKDDIFKKATLPEVNFGGDQEVIYTLTNTYGVFGTIGKINYDLPSVTQRLFDSAVVTEEINMTSRVKTYNTYCFYHNKPAVWNIDWPNGDLTFGSYCFRDTNIKVLDFVGPSSITFNPGSFHDTEIDMLKFYENQTVKVPATGTGNFATINNLIFNNSDMPVNLFRSATINNLTGIQDCPTIGGSAFRAATLPAGPLELNAKTFDSDAFNGATGPTVLTLNNAEKIGMHAFTNISSLTEVHLNSIPSSLPSSSYAVFAQCTNLTDVYCNFPSGSIAENKLVTSGQKVTFHYTDSE